MFAFMATDPRDLVYALLEISEDCEGRIEPDYSKSAEEVYSSVLTMSYSKLFLDWGPSIQ